jgi:hypothetical protein
MPASSNDPNRFFRNIYHQVPTDPFPLSPDEKRVSRKMIRYWANFAATPDPNYSGMRWNADQAGRGYGDFWLRYDSAFDAVQALATPHPHPEFSFGAEHQRGFWSQLGLESAL